MLKWSWLRYVCWRIVARNVMMLSVILGLASACTSVGQVGLMTRPGANPGALLTQETDFKEVGSAHGVACRYFVLAVVPWGDSTATRAFEKALEESGGDALINVTVSTSLYGFVPIYNVLSYTCTTVEGTAIRYTQPSVPSDTVARE